MEADSISTKARLQRRSYRSQFSFDHSTPSPLPQPLEAVQLGGIESIRMMTHRRCWGLFICVLLVVSDWTSAEVDHARPWREGSSTRGRKMILRDNGATAEPEGLVEPDPLILTYHNGPLLVGGTAKLFMILYGNWTTPQRDIIHDFLSSFNARDVPSPSVADWWSLVTGYRDSSASPVTGSMEVGGETYDPDYSKGRFLDVLAIEDLVLASLHPRGTFPTNHHAVYFVLTSPDVQVIDFCKNQCASHFATKPLNATDGRHLIYAWVGNAATQCPSKCMWPFAPPEFGPASKPLTPPNKDAGLDGLIINIGVMLSGAATNPFNSGYYQGDGAAPLEAASACAGIFGEGAYPGNPGALLVDQTSGASFNVHGVKGRKFMLPALWNPADLQCTPPQLAV